MTYFISSRWRNKDKVLELTSKLRDKKQQVYCFFESPANIHCIDVDISPEDAMQEFEAIPDWKNDKRVKDIFEDAVNKIKDSDVIILLLPAGNSAHIEIGIAYGLGKKCILIGEKKETESMYFIFNEFYNSIEDFINNVK